MSHIINDPKVGWLVWILVFLHIVCTIFLRIASIFQKEIRPDIFLAIKNRRWNTAATLLRDKSNHIHLQYAIRRQTIHKNSGYNALHCACHHRNTPLEIIHLLLAATTPTHFTHQEDDKYMTPLHYATRYASDDVILAVLRASPAAASRRDASGVSPLLVALRADRSCEVILALLDACPEMMMMPDKNTQLTPLKQFFNSWNFKLMALTLFDDMPCEYILELPITYRTDKRGTVRDIYKLTCCFLETLERDKQRRQGCEVSLSSSSSSPWLVAHAALRCGCPSRFIHLLLRVHPEQAWQEDERGNLLIHTIAATPSHAKQFSRATEYLLSLNPRAAMVPNPQGKLVLHLAIENDNEDYEDLFLGAPEAVRTRDVKTHMAPFMIAGEASTTTKSKMKSIDKFSCAFDLLMKDPTMLSFGIPE